MLNRDGFDRVKKVKELVRELIKQKASSEAGHRELFMLLCYAASHEYHRMCQNNYPKVFRGK